MFERGAVRNHARKRQCVDYSGMRFGKITPTDLDGLIEYHNESFALMELKHRGADLEYGQRTALVRMVDAITRSGKRAALFVASHQIDDPGQDIPADRCSIRAVYQRGSWSEDEAGKTLLEAVDAFLGYGAAVPTHNPMAQAPRQTEVVTDSELSELGNLFSK